MEINWINLLDRIAKALLWILLFVNLVIDNYEVTLVYALIIIAYNVSDIADVLKVKKDE